MTRTVSALCLAFLFVLPLQSKTLAQDITPPKIEALPPAGFETLGEPQPYFVDVVFGDEVVGQANVVARPGEVTLQSPGAVMELLPAIRAEVRGQVLQALTGALAANAGLSCEPRPREGCGLLEPAIAGVIFDDAVLRLTVFINPQFLDVDPSATAQRDLPPSSADGPAFYNPLSVFYAGTFNEETTHDLNAFSDSYLTWGEASIHVASSYFSQPLTTPEGEGGNFSLDDATFLYVRPGWLYQAGLADTASIDLLGTGRFLGAGVETTTATRLDLESAQGSSLVVFLPSRSTVELVVEGRTLSRRQYPAGNVALDTDGLPDGAYNLTIRIRDDAGNLTEETRFYARSTDVPLRDAPNYVLQAGVLVEDERSALPIVTDTPVVRAGAAYRLADDLALGADLLATPDIVIGSGTFDFFSTLGVFTGSVLATSEGDYGASATFYGTLDLFSYAFSGQLLERAQEPVDGGGGTANDLLGASYRQASLTLSYPINDNLDLSFQGYWRDDATTKMSYGFGPTLNWRIYNGPDLSITMNVAATHTDVETLGQLQFQISYNTGEQSRWSVNSTLGTLGAFDRADTSSYDRTYNPYAYAQAQWSDDELLVDDVRVYGGVAHDTQRTTSAFIGGGHKSQWADLSGEARRSYIEDGDVTTVMQAGLTTALSLDSNGIALGGAEIADAAIVIDLSSGDESVVYDVLVNGQKRVSLQGSTTAVLPLQPYHTYQVSLLPRGGASVQGELQQKTMTLYPGNSVTLSWETYRVLAIFGRVLDENGTAIGQARIDGDIGIAFSDEAGFFQIEVKDDTPLTLTKGGTSCRIDLAGSGVGLKQEVEYLNVGDLVCR